MLKLGVIIECAGLREAKSKKDHRDHVLASLTSDLTEATLIAQSATMEFNAITGDIPSSIPYPDGTQRIHNASRALSSARDEMMKAHNRLNDFLSRGIVPEDLNRTG